MIGLALQGGGSRGSYQAGAYYALKQAGIKIDGVCGTSIGAFNGAMIACGKELELLEFWKNISVGEILGFDSKYVEKRINKEYDLSYVALSFKHFINIIKRRGIEIKGLKEVLELHLDTEALIHSKMDYGLCTVRLHDLKPLYIFKENMNSKKIHDYILASCYLPLFRMEKMVDEHYYLDGGFYDNTPVNMLIKKGYKKIYVVELNPLINRKRKLLKDVEIIKITPKRSLGGILNFSPSTVEENIKMGYYDTLRVIKKLDGYHYCFKNYPAFFYNIITRKVSQKKRKRIMGFFNAKNNKQAVIKSLEYILQNENIDYYQIYKPYKMIRKLQKHAKKKHFVYEFLYQLKIL